MRVHLGSDHAGLDLKDHLLDLAAPTTATSRSTTARSSTTPSTTTRSSACGPPRASPPTASRGSTASASSSAARATASRSPPTRCRASAAALVWSEETAVLAREHNDANVVSVGGRMHPLEEMTRFVEVFLATPFSGEERHVRRIAPARRLRDAPASCRRCPSPPSGRRSRGRCLRATPSTGSPTTLDDAFAGRPVRVSSPQGRFADVGGAARRRTCSRAPRRRASTCSSTSPATGSCTSTSGYRQVRRAPRRRRRCRPRSARCGCGWSGRRGRAARVVRRPARRHHLRAGRPASSATRSWPGSAPTRCARTPTRTRAWQRIRRSRAPIGDLLMDQAVLAGVGNVYRAEVLFRHRMHPLRPGTHAARRASWRAMWDDLVDADGRGRAHRPDRHRAPRAHARGDGPPAARGRPRRRGLRLPARRASRATCAGPRSGPRCCRDATCSGVPGASAGSGPGPYSDATTPRTRTDDR